MNVSFAAEQMEDLGDLDDETIIADAFATGDDEALRGQKMTAKIAPGYDGRIPFYMYEEIVEEWLSITTLEKRLLGPNLRNRLTGAAASFKKLLNTEMLSDPEHGVEYFLTTLRPNFTKDAEHIFLWRFLRFIKKVRGDTDITLWIPSWEITFKYVTDAWMDLAPTCSDVTDITYRERVVRENEQITSQARMQHQANLAAYNQNPNQERFMSPNGVPQAPVYLPPNLFDANDAGTLDVYNRTVVRPALELRFPLWDHLLSLIFLANSE